MQCSGKLIVSQGTRVRGRIHTPGNPVRGALARSLGHVKLFVPAGRGATVIVTLNAHGRALARVHKLRTVILQLRSLGAKGKLVVTTRTVRLREVL